MTARAGADRSVEAVDLAFVGAGVSTAFVLLAVLAALAARPPDRPVRIVVVEPDPRPFTGVAYGSRAARTALLITATRDFLPPCELGQFLTWLRDHHVTAFAEFRSAAGPVGRRWWERHRVALSTGDAAGLYLPRYVFGDYLAERTTTAIAGARAEGTADTRVVRDEVRGLTRAGDQHVLECQRTTLRARSVVLAVGSPPVTSRLRAQGTPTGALVDRPFDSMNAALDRVRTALETRRRPGPPHVVVVGSNAGAMDVLHQVADLGEDVLQGATVTVVSPQGKLPARAAHHDTGRPYVPHRLLALTGAGQVQARAVYDAAVADIAAGEAAGVSAAQTLAPVSAAVGHLLPQLPPDQAREFAGRWGVELGRHQRRAGWEYHEVVDELTSAGRFEMVTGSLAGVRYTPGGVCVQVTREGTTRELSCPADVVFNCTGPAPDLRDLPVVAALIASGTCRATDHGRGVAVGPDLAAAPGLYVMGPLLAGNLVEGSPLWHLEHCGRISSLGSLLGNRLAADLDQTVHAPRTVVDRTAR